MANQIDATGIHTDTQPDIVANLTAYWRAIYGDDVNLDSNSPDGQLLNIFAQTIADVLDLVVQVYTSFDPDQAIGTALDARCAYNGVKRLGGTFTQVQILVTTDRALSLQGLDSSVNDPDGTGYTVSDNAGNQYILMNSYTFGAASPSGTLLTFRAKNTGAVLTTPATITIPVTIVLGVIDVNNPNPSLTTGVSQETDAQLHIRRQQSVAISSTSYLDSLLAALLNINGVVTARVYENNTNGTDGAGIPAHSIWAIVEGGSDADIGKAIYAKRSAGCGMYGAVVVAVVRPNGTTFDVKFDRVAQENLYLKFTLDSITGEVTQSGTTTSGSKIVTGLSDTSKYAVGQLLRSSSFPAGTTVESIDSASQIHASANATASGSVSILFIPINVATLKTEIVANLAPDIYETLNINQIASLVQSLNSNSLITFPSTNGLSSDGITYAHLLTPTARNLQFALTTGRITIV